jgi:hypothetical protein
MSSRHPTVVAMLWSLLALLPFSARADRFATDNDGHFVILKDDGTWRASTENGMLVDDRVNLTLNLLEPVVGGCRATFMLNNMTSQSFLDYLPVIHLLDSNQIEVGRSTLALPAFGRALEPHGLIYLTALAKQRVCWEITRARVTGFEGFCGAHVEQCKSVLFVHPSLHLPISDK